MLDIIALSAMSALTVFSLTYTIRLKIKNKKLVERIVQEALDKNIIIQRLNEELKKSQSAEVEKTDGFLKFISESRDWAFQYIENVQQELSDFKNEIEPRLAYADKYVRLAGDHPAIKIINEISEAYQKLKKVMPDENEK